MAGVDNDYWFGASLESEIVLHLNRSLPAEFSGDVGHPGTQTPVVTATTTTTGWYRLLAPTDGGYYVDFKPAAGLPIREPISSCPSSLDPANQTSA